MQDPAAAGMHHGPCKQRLADVGKRRRLTSSRAVQTTTYIYSAIIQVPEGTTTSSLAATLQSAYDSGALAVRLP